MNKIKRILKFSGIVIVLISIMAMPIIILNGWNVAVGWMEQWWLKEKIITAQNLSYKAPRLEELSVEKMIVKVAKQRDIDPNQFLRIAKCENGTHEADRKNYLWPRVSASGMFMFTDDTWIATRQQMSLPDPNLVFKHDSIENTKTAAWKIANGGLNAWNASKDCWT